MHGPRFSSSKAALPGPLPAVLLALALVLCLVSPGQAQTIYLSNLSLDTRAGEVALSFSLELDDTARVEGLLRDGATLALSCEAVLSKERSLWVDETVAEVTFRSLLAADGLTREFFLEQPGLERPLRGRVLSELLHEAWTRIVLDLTSLEQLERGETYDAKLTVGLRFDDVPNWLKQSLPFWSWEISPPETYEMEFVY